MAFCSNSGFGRLVDTDVIYTGPSITCGGTTVNPGDTVREFLSVVFLCSNDIVVDVKGNSLPIPDGTGIKVAFVGPGTYTQPGGPDVVVPSGHMGILNWDGSVWYLGSSVKTIKGEKGDVGPMGPKGDVGEKGDALAITGVVEDYSDLSSLSGLQEGDSYVVNSNGKLYIYNGDSFPSESEGIDLGLDLDVVPPRGENIFNQ